MKAGDDPPAVHSQIPESTKTDHAANYHEENTNNSEPGGAVVAPTSRQENHMCHVDSLSIASFVVSVATLAVVTWYGYTAYGQLQQMRVATKAATDSVVFGNRAWVVVTGTGFGYFKDKDGVERVSGRVILTNTGPSPAFNVHVWRCGQVRTDEPTVEEPPPGGRICVVENIGTIGRDIPITLNQGDSVDIVPKDSLEADMRASGRHYYVWGRITYEIFPRDPGGQKHFTSFCLLNAGEQLGPSPHRNDGD